MPKATPLFLLTELALRAEHDAIFRAERDATSADSAVRAVRDEDRDRDAPVGYGIGWTERGEF